MASVDQIREELHRMENASGGATDPPRPPKYSLQLELEAPRSPSSPEVCSNKALRLSLTKRDPEDDEVLPCGSILLSDLRNEDMKVQQMAASACLEMLEAYAEGSSVSPIANNIKNAVSIEASQEPVTLEVRDAGRISQQDEREDNEPKPEAVTVPTNIGSHTEYERESTISSLSEDEFVDFGHSRRPSFNFGESVEKRKSALLQLFQRKRGQCYCKAHSLGGGGMAHTNSCPLLDTDPLEEGSTEQETSDDSSAENSVGADDESETDSVHGAQNRTAVVPEREARRLFTKAGALLALFVLAVVVVSIPIVSRATVQLYRQPNGKQAKGQGGDKAARNPALCFGCHFLSSGEL